jgi:hypothetical protein
MAQLSGKTWHADGWIAGPVFTGAIMFAEHFAVVGDENDEGVFGKTAVILRLNEASCLFVDDLDHGRVLRPMHGLDQKIPLLDRQRHRLRQMIGQSVVLSIWPDWRLKRLLMTLQRPVPVVL